MCGVIARSGLINPVSHDLRGLFPAQSASFSMTDRPVLAKTPLKVRQSSQRAFRAPDGGSWNYLDSLGTAADQATALLPAGLPSNGPPRMDETTEGPPACRPHQTNPSYRSFCNRADARWPLIGMRARPNAARRFPAPVFGLGSEH